MPSSALVANDASVTVDSGPKPPRVMRDGRPMEKTYIYKGDIRSPQEVELSKYGVVVSSGKDEPVTEVNGDLHGSDRRSQSVTDQQNYPTHIVFPPKKKEERYSFAKYNEMNNTQTVVNLNGQYQVLRTRSDKRDFYNTCKHKFTDGGLAFNATHMDKFIKSDINKVLNMRG